MISVKCREEKKRHFCSSESSLSLLAKNACTLSPRQYCLLSLYICVCYLYLSFTPSSLKTQRVQGRKKKRLFVDSVPVWFLFGWMTRCYMAFEPHALARVM